MEYTHLGETGLEVSRLCLGCAGFSTSDTWDWNVSDREEGLAVIDHALDRGITFLDTANTYSDGESERIVGEAIEGIREEVVLASKVGEAVENKPNRRGGSRKHVLEQIETSLERLDTDYLDIYYLHQWDFDTPITETLAAFDHLVNEGLVRYIGASNLAGWRLMEALKDSELENLERFVVIQPEYNLLRRHEEENLLPVAAAEGLGVASYAPIASGFLTGDITREDGPAASPIQERTWRDLGMFDREECWAVLDIVREIAAREDATPVQVSVAWLLQSGPITSPIIGPQSIEHIDEYCGSFDVELTDDDVARLEAPIDPVWNHDMIASQRW